MRVYKNIVMPRKDTELILLGRNIVTEYKKQTTPSVLDLFDMEAFAELVGQLEQLDTLLTAMRATVAKLGQEKVSLLGRAPNQNLDTPGTLLNTIVKVRDALLAVNKGKEKKLVVWGFKVVLRVKGKN